jgi:hypothetical protein
LDDQPGPTAPETIDTGGSELFFKRDITSEGRMNGLGQCSRWLAPFAWAKNAPEKGMIRVSPTIIADGHPFSIWDASNLGDQGIDGQIFEFGPSQGIIYFGDIGLMVLGVMNFHGLSIEMGFECIVGVGKCREGIGHDESPMMG